jgi:hypothetical protein
MSTESTSALLRLFRELLDNNPEIEKSAQRVNAGLETFGQRMSEMSGTSGTSEPAAPTPTAAPAAAQM